MFDDLKAASSDYFELLSNLNDIILYSNFILALKEKLEKGAMYKVRAVTTDIELVIDTQKYIIEYESNKKSTLSIFAFIQKTFENFRKSVANNFSDNVKAESCLIKILDDLEL